MVDMSDYRKVSDVAGRYFVQTTVTFVLAVGGSTRSVLALVTTIRLVIEGLRLGNVEGGARCDSPGRRGQTPGSTGGIKQTKTKPAQRINVQCNLTQSYQATTPLSSSRILHSYSHRKPNLGCPDKASATQLLTAPADEDKTIEPRGGDGSISGAQPRQGCGSDLC